ncbi:NUDIX domain-containing protein [Brachybacterium sp. J144]|uniref:NUDIX domain-containing protein n=1 Tax=Brachybacterium sp. J144 TaxID=3116487 RepID=UPI002E7A45CE|nr:NUDIX domain-containing protein [Brachybacterium sp. J144]MEE1649544.1 NUDIX domain-containing protein [Brachybacterium sp. J144]
MTGPSAPPRPPRRIVLVAGPSGSGKGVMARRAGLPTVPLDDFYRDHDDPGLPRRFGIVDWDDPASWNAGAALEALTALAHDGVADVPEYSIPLSRRTGTTSLAAGDAELIIAEGIFAAELVRPLREMGLLADAIVLHRPTPVVFALRLARDLREGRKPPLTLLRRGVALAREQHADIAGWRAAGMRPVGLRRGTQLLRLLAALTAAERCQRQAADAGTLLRITAVAFLREGARGEEILAVRKRGTGSYMQVGGKLEPAESALEAAVREVGEELGVVLDPAGLELLGDFEAVAANEPGTRVRSTVFVCRQALPEPLTVRAELADHRWFPLAESEAGVRLAPLMTEHIVPALLDSAARTARG